LEEQRGDDASIYNYYRQAIAIRKAVPAISHGRTTAEKPLNIGCVSAFRKTWGNEECIILMNISQEQASVDLTSYEGWSMATQLCVGEEKCAADGAILQMPAYAVAVLLPQK
jgi:glycosidase